jgi:hypothetical protein
MSQRYTNLTIINWQDNLGGRIGGKSIGNPGGFTVLGFFQIGMDFQHIHPDIKQLNKEK